MLKPTPVQEDPWLSPKIRVLPPAKVPKSMIELELKVRVPTVSLRLSLPPNWILPPPRVTVALSLILLLFVPLSNSVPPVLTVTLDVFKTEPPVPRSSVPPLTVVVPL